MPNPQAKACGFFVFYNSSFFILIDRTWRLGAVRQYGNDAFLLFALIEADCKHSTYRAGRWTYRIRPAVGSRGAAPCRAWRFALARNTGQGRSPVSFAYFVIGQSMDGVWGVSAHVDSMSPRLGETFSFSLTQSSSRGYTFFG